MQFSAGAAGAVFLAVLAAVVVREIVGLVA